jgi:hypothetical protein
MGRYATGVVLIFIGLAGLASARVFFQQAGSGMLGYWKCDDTATPSKDSSGNSNDGVWTATGVAGLTGAANSPLATPWSTGCLQFSAAQAQVAVPGTTALTNALLGDWTVSFWMYPDADGNDWQRLVGKGAATTPGDPSTALNRTFGVWRYPGADHHFLFQQSNNGNYFLNIESAATTPNQTWTHVAARRQGTNATLFINGSAANGASATGITTAPGAVATDPLTFGYAGFHTCFPGRLTDIRFYDLALSDADIIALSAGGFGPAAPTGLTATGGASTIQLNWNALPSGVYNVKRATVPGGPYTTIASNVATNSYTDTPPAIETTYYYVVSGVTYGEGPNSNEAFAVCGPVTALPNMGLQTSESGATATFNVIFNAPAPAGGSTVTVTSNAPGIGQVSSDGVNFFPVVTISEIAGFMGYIPITVKGVDDFVVTPNQNYTVSVSVTGFSPVPSIPNINLTNLEVDTLGILVSKNSVTTTTAGGQDSFSVSLNSEPVPNSQVTIAVTSSNTSEATVSPATLTFTPGTWNIAQPVTVTGVGVNVTYLNTPFTVSLSVEPSPPAPASPAPDPAYVGLTSPPAGPIVISGTNLHLEVPPALPRVWGGSSGGGGCGLLGLEIGLPLLFLRLRRRRLH